MGENDEWSGTGPAPRGFDHPADHRIRRRGHDLGFWLVVMNTRFDANAGMAVRVASNFGASGLAFVGMGSFKRAASLGAGSSVPLLHFETPEAAVAWCLAEGITLICAELTERSIPIHHATWPERCAFVIGDERDGIPKALLDAAAVIVEIPMYGLAGSMNLALAAGVLAYEHVRRLGFPELERIAQGGRRSGWSRRPGQVGGGSKGGE